MKRKQLEEWRYHVDVAEKVGMSAKAYCRKHRLKENQFYYWRSKLRDGSSSKAEGSGFQSIAIQPGSDERVLSIRLGNGVRIEFSREPDVAWMKAFLELL